MERLCISNVLPAEEAEQIERGAYWHDAKIDAVPEIFELFGGGCAVLRFVVAFST